ncbi:hypothetical protein X731_17265 [Mesorhizobium sp. L2C054A000]|nr:hypothetical protein X731_17265 [Mesorhizobium sp. L2C054A000]
MVAYAQALGQVTDRDRPAIRKPLDRQQRLMLARRQAGIVGLRLAEFEEAPDQVTEFGQALVVGLRDGGAWVLWHGHFRSLSPFV